MKKTLLSILAGVVIIGSAFAVPSADDRQKLCEKTDGYVWVEKNQACIEKNPCESDNEEIERAYCIRPDFRVPDPSKLPKVSDSKFTSLVLRKYFQNMMNTDIYTLLPLSSLDDEGYVAVITTDKGYYVVDFDMFYEPNVFAPHDTLYMEELYKATCWSYGKKATNAGVPETNFEMKCDNTTESECESIVDFANSLLQSIGGSGQIYLRYRDLLKDYNRCYMAIYAY